MELEELMNLTGNIKEMVEKITATKSKNDTGYEMYEIANHIVKNTGKYKDRTMKNSEGKDETVYVNRLPLSLQKQIVLMSVTFLCGNPVKLSCTPTGDVEEGMLSILKTIWDENKLHYDTQEIAKRMMSETKVAELWYPEPVEPDYWNGTINEGAKFRWRMQIVSPALGDDLYPILNSRKDMIAFGRGYSVKDGDKEIPHFDLYTSDNIYHAVKGDEDWGPRKEKGSDGIEREISPNIVGKIPVIYYEQPAVEWSDVQPLIERLEESLSKHGDTNDYNGSPMTVVEGKIKSFAKKGESGKLIELENGGKVYYLTWDHSPVSIQLEQKNLRSFIFDLSQTPDISIEQMKALGTYSGIALKMLFLNAHIKAADKEANFGKCMQRRINFLKKANAVLNSKLEKALRLRITPEFEYYLPKNELEMIQMIGEAKAGGFMSGETSTEQNPRIEDGKAEWEKIQAEKKAGDNDPAGLDNEMDAVA